MSDHEKRHLARGVELEKRRYIGFSRVPVLETGEVFVSGLKPFGRDPTQVYPSVRGYPGRRRPYFDNREDA